MCPARVCSRTRSSEHEAAARPVFSGGARGIRRGSVHNETRERFERIAGPAAGSVVAKASNRITQIRFTFGMIRSESGVRRVPGSGSIDPFRMRLRRPRPQGRWRWEPLRSHTTPNLQMTIDARLRLERRHLTRRRIATFHLVPPCAGMEMSKQGPVPHVRLPLSRVGAAPTPTGRPPANQPAPVLEPGPELRQETWG
jgi:hypothetical protein